MLLYYIQFQIKGILSNIITVDRKIRVHQISGKRQKLGTPDVILIILYWPKSLHARKRIIYYNKRFKVHHFIHIHITLY